MKKLVICLSLSFMVLQPGCSGGPGDTPDTAPVSGTIKVDGKAKEGLQVSFQPEEGRPSTGSTDSSGHYHLNYSLSEEGAKVGKGVIQISTPEPVDDCCGTGCGECGAGCGDGSGYVDPIPARYNSDAANNPEMNVEVKAGEDNVFDFDVDTSGGGNAPSPDCGDSSFSCCCG